MSTSNQIAKDDPKDDRSPRQPFCPVCNGQLVELRGQYRCARCYFMLCVGCENVDMTNYCAAGLE